jgi:hypothetical protein
MVKVVWSKLASMNRSFFLMRVLVLAIFVNGPIVKSIARTSAGSPAQIVTYCQLIKAPSSFVGKRIRVRAVYSYMFEVSRLKSPECCPDRDIPIWVDFNEELEGSSQKLLHKFPKGMGLVLATFEGTLQGGDSYGDGGYRFKFAVDKIENLENKANPSRDHHPSWIPICDASGTTAN